MEGLSRLSSTSACFLEARDGFSHLIRRVINILGKTVIVHRLPARREANACSLPLTEVDYDILGNHMREPREHIYNISHVSVSARSWTRNQLRKSETKRPFLPSSFCGATMRTDRSRFLFLRVLD